MDVSPKWIPEWHYDISSIWNPKSRWSKVSRVAVVKCSAFHCTIAGSELKPKVDISHGKLSIRDIDPASCVASVTEEKVRWFSDPFFFFPTLVFRFFWHGGGVRVEWFSGRRELEVVLTSLRSRECSYYDCWWFPRRMCIFEAEGNWLCQGLWNSVAVKSFPPDDPRKPCSRTAFWATKLAWPTSSGMWRSLDPVCHSSFKHCCMLMTYLREVVLNASTQEGL